MPWYSVNTSILINSMRMGSTTVKQVWLADDSAGEGRIKRCMTGKNILAKKV